MLTFFGFKKKGITFASHSGRAIAEFFDEIIIAKIAQLVEHNLAKVRVAGSSPVFRSLSPRESSSVGRARPSQGRGRGFEPRFSLFKRIILMRFFCLQRFRFTKSRSWDMRFY